MSESTPPRANRFDIQVPLRYRVGRESAWHNGRTKNISRTGVLFWANEFIEPHTSLDISFEMPVAIGGRRGAEVICKAEIVRAVLSVEEDVAAGVAAKFLDYQLIPSGERLAA